MKKEFRCKKCLIPRTRPGIKFDEDGICFPCKISQRTVDWEGRFKELETLCDQYRGKKPYDMIIPVSGGKDSTYQVGFFKETMNMNPLCVMVDNASWTETGRKNFQNLSKRFDVDIITFTPAVKTMTEKSRKGFFEELWPEKYWDSILYEKPLEIAQKFGIQFVAWGEDTSVTTGGADYEETPSALKLLPKHKQEKYQSIDAIFLSYYVKWSRYDNVEYAKENGFLGLDDTNEWARMGLQGFDYEQVDTVGYLCNQFFKFIHFGFSNQTELCSDAIRQGKMTRDEAMIRVNLFDWQVDKKMVQDFCQCLEISEVEFWTTVNKFANRDLLENESHGNWRLRDPAK